MDLIKQSIVCCGLTVLLNQVTAGPTNAHPPDENRNYADAHADSSRPALLLPGLSGAKPWSHKPVLNDPSRFHFAIMTNRTGSHRPGIWSHGVRKANLMRPEFVVSVGDLMIEGYTTEEDVLEREWQEFLGFIDQLDMRFFFFGREP